MARTGRRRRVLTLDGFDLRDAGLSITPDNRLMLIGGAAPRKTDKDHAPTGTFVAFSDDGKNWTKPQIVVEPGRWLWRVNWHDGKAYGIAYASVRPLTDADLSRSCLSATTDYSYRDLVPKLFGEGTPTEATLRFANDGTMYCLQRRDGDAAVREVGMFSARAGRPTPIGSGTIWACTSAGRISSSLPSGQWIAAGRFFDDKTPKTKLACARRRKEHDRADSEATQRRRHELPGPRLARRHALGELLFEPRRQNEHLSGEGAN